jgi:hypothetical protein
VAWDRIDRNQDYLTLSLDRLFKRQIHNLTDGIFPGLLLTGCPILLLYNSEFGELAQLVRATEIISSKFLENPQSFQRDNTTQEIGVRTMCVTLHYTQLGSLME